MNPKCRKSDWVLMGILSALVLLCAALGVAGKISYGGESLVENRKAALYDPARIPQVTDGGNININTADAALLDTLPGIGEILARRIIAYREENGAFPHQACITEVKGIGEKTYAELAPLICTE